MAPLGSVVPAVLQQVSELLPRRRVLVSALAQADLPSLSSLPPLQAGLAGKVQPEECKMLLKGAVLDQSTPFR